MSLIGLYYWVLLNTFPKKLFLLDKMQKHIFLWPVSYKHTVIGIPIYHISMNKNFVNSEYQNLVLAFELLSN